MGSNIGQIAVHIGEQARLNAHKHRCHAIASRPADDGRGLAPLANAGLVGNHGRLTLLDLVDGGGHGVHLQAHQRAVQRLGGFVAQLLAGELVNVAYCIFQAVERILRGLRHVRWDEHALVLAGAAWNIGGLELIASGSWRCSYGSCSSRLCRSGCSSRVLAWLGLRDKRLSIESLLIRDWAHWLGGWFCAIRYNSGACS